MTTDITQLSDDALNNEAKRIAHVERRATAELLRLLIEVERRMLHLALGHSSLFAYCTRALRLSEQAAYSRITAARTARRFPPVLDLLADGALTLSSVGLLSPHLTDETADLLLDAARHKSTREVERLLAHAHPQPDIPTHIRALPCERPKAKAPEPMPPVTNNRVESKDVVTNPVVPPPQSFPSSSASPWPRPLIAPIAPDRYLLKLTVSQDTREKLQRARASLRHSIPDGDIDQILNRALALLLDQIVRTKFGASRKPRRDVMPTPKGRRIPAAVKRVVWRRDQGRCAFAGPDGICGETAFLEFHHVIPFAAGGPTDVANLQLRCRAHNAYEARAYFGPARMDECM